MKAILTYHSIDNSGSVISLSPEVFRAHRTFLLEGHVRVLSLDDIVAHPADGPDAVALTFDDGFLNAAESLHSLLREGLPVAMFVVSGRVGRTNEWGGHAQPGIPTQPLLDWPDLERLAAAGARLEAHTRTHPALTHLSADAIDEELQGCRDELHHRLGTDCAHFAYPYGDVSPLVAGRASRVFRFSHTTDFRLLNQVEAPMHLPRLDMFYFRTSGALESWGSRRFRQRLAWIGARRRIRRLVRP